MAILDCNINNISSDSNYQFMWFKFPTYPTEKLRQNPED